jgi:Mn-dependent DtxR family transcriptional regulator
MTKTEKLLNAFKNGETLTRKQIASRFGIKNPTAVITHLRQDGHSIYCNKRKERNSLYRLGTPSQRVVAAGYKALAAFD